MPDDKAFYDQYNTALNPLEEVAFRGSVARASRKLGRDLSMDQYDYDIRGAWKAGVNFESGQHGPDTYKKPNHPTFSNESRYSGVRDPKTGLLYIGGEWSRNGSKDVFTSGQSQRRLWSKERLADYMRTREPGVEFRWTQDEPLFVLR